MSVNYSRNSHTAVQGSAVTKCWTRTQRNKNKTNCMVINTLASVPPDFVYTESRDKSLFVSWRVSQPGTVFADCVSHECM